MNALAGHFDAANDDRHFLYQTHYLLVEKTDLAKADIALVFGNQHAYEPLAREAARLYHEGYCDRIVVSGGRLDRNGFVEAEMLEYHLMQQNVPLSDVITEADSTNTQENVLFTKARLALIDGPDSIQSVIAVGSIVAGRRFLMTLAQNWPQILAMASNVNPFPFPVSEFGKHDISASVVRSEFAKITKYKEAGYITDVYLDSLNSRVSLLPPPTPRGAS